MGRDIGPPVPTPQVRRQWSYHQPCREPHSTGAPCPIMPQPEARDGQVVAPGTQTGFASEHSHDELARGLSVHDDRRRGRREGRGAYGNLTPLVASYVL